MENYHEIKQKLEEDAFKRKCIKCNYVMQAGDIECPLCTNLSSAELISIHKQQAKEGRKVKLLGCVFLLVFVVVAMITGFYII